MIYLHQAHHSLGIGIAKEILDSCSHFIMKQGQWCTARNIDGLIESLGVKYDAMKWRLFIDSATRSLKAIF